MKRTLIALAVTMAAAGAAHAQMNLYGLIDLSYGKADPKAKADFHSGGDDGSGQGNSTTRVGIKGSTDIGSGIKGNFKFETGGITMAGEVNPGGAFFNRQAWFGFSGGFGEVRLGRQDSVPFQTMIDFDFNGAANTVSALGWATVGPWAPTLGRQSRSLQYISPEMGGLKVQLGVVPEGNQKGTKTVISGGVTYGVGGLKVAVSAQSKETNAGDDFFSVAGSYDLGVVKVMTAYADGGKNAKGVSIGAVAPVAGVNIGFLYGKNSDTKVGATEVFVNSEVFKNTYAYADFGRVDKGAAKGNRYAVGVIYVF
jgi:predicted porin